MTAQVSFLLLQCLILLFNMLQGAVLLHEDALKDPYLPLIQLAVISVVAKQLFHFASLSLAEFLAIVRAFLGNFHRVN